MTSFNRVRGSGRRIRGYQEGGDAALPDYNDPTASDTPTPDQSPPSDSSSPDPSGAPSDPGFNTGLLPDSMLTEAPAPPTPDWSTTYAGPVVTRPSGIPGITFEYKWNPGNPALGTPGGYVLAGHLADPRTAPPKTSTARGTDPRSFVLDAVREYLNAQAEGDRRRESAQSAFEKMAPYALPAGSTTFPGFGVGGPAQQAETLAGARTYSPPTPVMQSISPQRMAQPMPVDQFVQQMLGRVTG